ncbi:MAG: tRNA (adenosine(37)-N6)-threonylcarbamoyltransferase complex dimerization subunit type 1 TsaB [Clostridia bacterium]|nr:tRNA (adenosine(37)-N6)-threonylcarbamoyltransferase complex dimerization subunit type 1 TsaB [Clostridia bacterium]
MKNYLAIDSSSKHLTIAACKNGKRAVRYLPDCAMRHSVLLMGEIESALSSLSLTPAECDLFCAVTGPGSFTGIRIGISAAKGFALGAGKQLLPLTAFEMIAYNVNTEKDFLAVVDAAHNHYYCMRFTGGKAGDAKYLAREDVISYGLPVFGYEELDLPQYTRIYAGDALYKAAEKKMEMPEAYGEMTALYVRKSQAEEGRL